MAVLGATTLTGCDSIPQFIQTGDKMLFNMATPPNSWTKDTTPNQHTLRVINGSTSPSGSLTFPQVFTSRPYSATMSAASITVGLGAVAVFFPSPTPNNSTLPTVTIQPHIGSEQTTRPHYHEYQGAAGQNNPRAGTGTSPALSNVLSQNPTNTGPVGQAGGHPHSITVTHTHSFSSLGPHSHDQAAVAPHTHPITSGSFDGFSLTYVDIIIATKN